MSISGLSAISSGTSYDFTSMTPKQLLSAGSQMYRSGQITEQQNATLMGLACSYAPGPGESQLPNNLGLDSTASFNFLQELKNNIAELREAGGAFGTRTYLMNDQALLQAFTAYQGQNVGVFSSQTRTQLLRDTQA